MKKLSILFLLVLFFFANHSKAQGVVALTTASGQTTTYSLLSSALSNAVSGDFIYLPGGVFTLGSSIGKGIKIIGTGHYPDSTIYTDRTIIQGSITIAKGAHQLLLEGLYITGNINFSDDSRSDNVVIRRCNLSSINVGSDCYRNDTAKCFNPVIIHNVIRGSVSVPEANGFILKGNIISGQLQVSILHGGLVENNIFLSKGINNTLTDLRYVTFKNNIFMNDTTLGYQGYACYGYDGSCGTFGCNFLNNLFVGKQASINITSMASVLTNNLFQINATSIFVNQSGTTFNYSHNYHLQSTSAGINAGNDGKDVGIYGTLNPYKDGAVPVNPHISYKNVPESTLPNGSFQVNFKVNAQDK